MWPPAGRWYRVAAVNTAMTIADGEALIVSERRVPDRGEESRNGAPAEAWSLDAEGNQYRRSSRVNIFAGAGPGKTFL